MSLTLETHKIERKNINWLQTYAQKISLWKIHRARIHLEEEILIVKDFI